jgi:hypothetical protein
VELFVLVEAVEDFLLGLVADRAGVVEDEAGVGFVGGLGVALLDEGADDLFGVVGVHLAAEGFDVKGLHTQEPVYGSCVESFPMKKTGLIWGATLIFVAVAPYGYVQFRLRSHNWTPLSAPVNLVESSDVVSPEFKTDLTGRYVVGLDFAPINIDLEECLVGDTLFKDSCKSVGSGLDMDWSVVHHQLPKDVMVIDHRVYKPQGFGGAGVIETVLGDFDAQAGEKYRILLHVRKIVPELNSASPKISVEAGRIYWEKWIIFAQLSLLFAIFPGIGGVIVLGWAIFNRRRAV